MTPLLLAATPSDRSWADWSYDVSKSVASAAVIAFAIGVVGKGLGWGFLVRIRWRVLGTFGAVIFCASVGFLAAAWPKNTLQLICRHHRGSLARRLLAGCVPHQRPSSRIHRPASVRRVLLGGVLGSPTRPAPDQGIVSFVAHLWRAAEKRLHGISNRDPAWLGGKRLSHASLTPTAASVREPGAGLEPATVRLQIGGSTS
jgi:hypothetical protein